MTMPDADEQFDSGYDVEEDGPRWDGERDLPMWGPGDDEAIGGYAPV